MATTKDFQKVPDFFMSKDDTKPINTNPRYPNFFQTHFTTGNDEHIALYSKGISSINRMYFTMRKN